MSEHLGGWGSTTTAPRSQEADPWGMSPASKWDTAPEAASADWGKWESELTQPSPTAERQSSVSEKIGELRQKLIHSFGRKALDAVMGRLPSFGGRREAAQAQTLDYYDANGGVVGIAGQAQELWAGRQVVAEQGRSIATGAAREVAGAGVQAAKEAVMDYYGLEKDENDKLRIARKIKFGKAALKTVVALPATATSVGIRAGHAARKAAKDEGFSQLRQARATVSGFNTSPSVNANTGW